MNAMVLGLQKLGVFVGEDVKVVDALAWRNKIDKVSLSNKLTELGCE